MEIEEKEKLTKYELMPKRKLYIAVYKMHNAFYSYSSENKEALFAQVRNFYGVSNIKIYTVDCDE